MDDISLWIQIPAALLLLVGAFFTLVGAIGMARFGDFYMRMHPPTKATTLGVGSIVVASVVLQFAFGEFAIRELLITLFLFITAPISANLMAKAALHLRVDSTAPPPDELPHA